MAGGLLVNKKRGSRLGGGKSTVDLSTNDGKGTRPEWMCLCVCAWACRTPLRYPRIEYGLVRVERGERVGTLLPS
jgi:hypothetical protein